jgi:enhancer of polycomb-like protein
MASGPAREHDIQKEIQNNVDKHIRWNEGFIDKTMAPLTPDFEDPPSPSNHFREAMAATEYLPTPPASVSDDESPRPIEGTDVVMKDASRPSTPFRYASPVDDDSVGPMPSFRRRVGRGGRIMVDRRLPMPRRDPLEDERFKFDSDDDEISESEASPPKKDIIYARMSQRAYLLGNNSAQLMSSRRAQLEAGGPSHSPSVPPTQPVAAPV